MEKYLCLFLLSFFVSCAQKNETNTFVYQKISTKKIKDIKKYTWNIGGRRSFLNLNEAKVVKFIIKAYLCNLYIMCKE